MNQLANALAIEKLTCLAFAGILTGGMVLGMHGLSSRPMASDALFAVPSSQSIDVNSQFACVVPTRARAS